MDFSTLIHSMDLVEHCPGVPGGTFSCILQRLLDSKEIFTSLCREGNALLTLTFILYLCLSNAKYVAIYCSYTVENPVRFGALGNTDQPKLRQALALEVWQSISRALQPGEKLTVLTNGPLTNLANIIDRDKSAAEVIQVSRIC